MLKTLKRKIALVAVAGLGAGLISVTPASATDAATTAANVNLTQTGSTLAVKTDTAAARAGVQTIKITEAAAVDTAYHLAVTTAACDAIDATMLLGMATLTGDAGTAIANAGTVNNYTLGKIVVVGPAADASTLTITTASLAAGTWNVCADPSAANSFATDGFSVAVITVVDAGAPASVSWASNVREVNPIAVDYTSILSVKDSNGVATILVGAENITLDVSPQTGVVATQVVFTDADITADNVTATTGKEYSVNFDGATAGGTGNTVAGTTYSLTAQLGTTAGNAIGAPATGTYTRVSNTAGLTGTLSFSSDAAGATAITTISTAPTVASTGYFVKAVDATGAVLKGVTINLALSGVTGATSVTSDTTAQTGITSSRTATPTAAGTGVITASINAGTTTISKTLAITSVAFGAIAPLAAGVTATAVNGNGLIAGDTAGTTWTASRSTTSMTLKVSGLTANTTVRVEPAGTAVDVKAAGVTEDNNALNDAGQGFLTTDAAGLLTIAVTLTSAANNNTALIRVDADAGGNLAALDITVSFVDAAAALTTVPASATTSFVGVSSSQTITASIADQYANPIVGGSVLITNTSAPTLVTLVTAVAVNVSNTGTATLTAPIAATIGNYVYTVQARDANGANVGTLSTITYTATTDGAPGSVTLTSGGSEAALGSFTVWNSTNGRVPLAVTINGGQTANQTADASLSTDTAVQALAKVGDHVVITVKVSNAAGTGIDNVKVGVVGSAGVYLATTQPANNGTTKLSAMTSTSATSTGGGVATIHAVATKVGTNTVTFTVGSKTATATFISKHGLTTQSIARTVTLGSATVAVTGGAITQSVATVTDAFGNPVEGVTLTGTISGVAGRFAGGARSFPGTTDAAGQVTFEITANTIESGAGLLTVAGVAGVGNAETTGFLTGDLSGNISTLGILESKSTTGTIAVTAGVADSSSTQIKTDIATANTGVATANAAVKALATQVTVLQASVATLIDSLTTQIAALLQSVSALTKAVAKLQAASKKK